MNLALRLFCRAMDAALTVAIAIDRTLARTILRVTRKRHARTP